MKILILETSTEKACLVLAENEHVLNSQPLDGGPQLSKTLAIQVKFILSGIVPDLIAVGTGPGSYTGIRVGAALAQGLSFGWNIPLLGFCSLHGYNSEITPIIDARSAGFYILFDGKPTLVSSTDPRLLHTALASPHPEAIKKRLNTPCLEASPDPDLLAHLVYRQFTKEGAYFELSYLSTPN